MRIAVDARSVFPGCGGIGRYTQNLAAHMPALSPQDEFVLFCCTAKGAMRVAQAPNTREEVFQTGMMDAMWEQLSLPNELARVEADAYHSPMFTLPAVTACPTVVTIHDVVFETHPEWVGDKLCSYLSKWSRFAAQTATRIVTVSEFSKQEIVRVYGVDPNRVDVTLEAADRRFFPIEERDHVERVAAKHGLPEQCLLYVGSMETKKNIENLLVAFKRAVDQAGLPHKLALVGGRGGQALDLDALLDRHGCRELVVRPGYVPDGDLPFIYNAAEAFIYPSLYEGFGLPPLEAMACGVPVISSNATSLPEVVGDAGVLVDPEDTDSMAEAIAGVLTDEGQRSDLRQKGLTRAAEFSWEQTARQTLDVYRQAVEGDDASPDPQPQPEPVVLPADPLASADAEPEGEEADPEQPE